MRQKGRGRKEGRIGSAWGMKKGGERTGMWGGGREEKNEGEGDGQRGCVVGV